MRFHLFPFRTEKLSSLTPMVLRFFRGRVGSRLFKVRSSRSDLFLCRSRRVRLRSCCRSTAWLFCFKPLSPLPNLTFSCVRRRSTTRFFECDYSFLCPDVGAVFDSTAFLFQAPLSSSKLTFLPLVGRGICCSMNVFDKPRVESNDF